jgi:hypothetical protein
MCSIADLGGGVKRKNGRVMEINAQTSNMGYTLLEESFVANAARVAFANMWVAFSGESERLGLTDEQDVVTLVDEVLGEMWKERYENND